MRMLPTHTKQLLEKLVDAGLNDSHEALQRALNARAAKNLEMGLLGGIGINAQVLTAYDEYKRRADLILECVKRTLQESSFRYYTKLAPDLTTWFLAQLERLSSDVEAKIKEFHSDEKPTFADFKRDLHQRIAAEIELASESYLTHHREVVRSWWAANGRRLLRWLLGAIGAILIALAIAWLTKKYIK